ncbi:hypothetical protein TraAM80_00397 [Trypanosoma rangeli]|uniref:Uncharacterized protein n=1 Tax=Trypanosoma rangeli TaxID=5698 RepID=A0A422P3E4_TRYRA|nr:uncharacterized protein TraAM80_00397 [Trypanosoma rangeli]RNF12250.1 hypothetical protein TraAM80_00397 [Trypanosoma rangeli]|eukprot:RNF12250.1 hypothetical protein TraAM80_00397 [Trypanosoma rangeli]
MGKLGAGLDVNEKRKPVGSLFMEAMDRDSIPPHVRRTVYHRLADRSLPNTPFSLYPEEPGRTRVFPTSGRRHFPDRNRNNPVAPDPPEVSPARRAVSRQETSHLDCAAQAINEEAPVHYSRQRCRQPPFSKDPVKMSHPHALTTLSPLRRSRLLLGSLTPMEEPQKERPVPPPMIKKPLRFGRRHTPEPRSVSAEHRRVGIKMVPPPPHWESATERRMAFTNFGVDACRVNGIQHRNQSQWEIGFSSPLRLHRSMSTESNVNDRTTPPDDEVPRRGRRYSSSPGRRNADIISWMPLKYC